MNTPFISIIHKLSILRSIALLTIQHQGMKSALRLQKSMTTCPLPTAFLWQAAKKPLLKLSMPFFNSQLCFHLKRQAKTNYSSLRSTMGISTLPTLIIIGKSVSPFPLPLKIQPIFKDKLVFCSPLCIIHRCQPPVQLCPAELQLCFSMSG